MIAISHIIKTIALIGEPFILATAWAYLNIIYFGIAILIFGLIGYYFYHNKTKYQNFSDKLQSIHKNTSNRSTDIGTTLYQIVNHIPYAACIVNSEGRISVSNVQFIAQCRKNRNELFQQIWHEALKININNQSILLNREKEYILHPHKNSTLKIKTKPLLLENLQVSLCTIVIEDITHIEKKLDDIEYRKQYFKEIIDKTNLALLVEDHEGNILEASIAASSLLEVDYSELRKKRLLDFTPVFQHDLLLNRNSNSTQVSLKDINHLITNKNNEVPININSFEIDYYGTNANFYLINDVSKKVRIQNEIKEAKRKAEESDRLKSSFLANISHEIRTPMNSIMGFTELMCDEQISNTERKDFHNIVKTSANNLLNLINDIMEFSKIESGIIKLKNEDLNIKTLFVSLEKYALDLLKEHQSISFEVDYPEVNETSPIIETDQYRVEQILRQLINNAIKFTYKGKVHLGCNFQNDGAIEFVIKDTGIGIPKEKTSSIFQKFRQGSDDNSRDFGGAGLGLSICHHLTKSLGGYMWLKSKEDYGSTFYLNIPQFNINHLSELNNPRILTYKDTSQNTSALSFIPSHQRICAYNKEALFHIPQSNDIAVLILEGKQEQLLNDLKEQTEHIQYPIILHDKGYSSIIYSPKEKDIGRTLGKNQDLMLFINAWIQNELQTKTNQFQIQSV